MLIMVRKKRYRNVFNTYLKKSVVPERFIRTLKNKIDKYMTSVSKNVFIDKLDDIVYKYNNRHHIAIKMKLFVKPNRYILCRIKY